jgi:hypothetical protein
MIGPMALNFRVSNIGRGPASHVQVDFTVLGLNTIKRSWKQQLLTPGQFQDFFIPISENEEQHYITYFETNETKIKLSSICKDVIGKNHSNQEEIDVSEYVKQFKRTKSVYAEDRLDTISRNMKSIPDELKMISRNISSIENIISDKINQDLIAYRFRSIYAQLNQMNIAFEISGDLELFINSLENELRIYRRDDMLKVILNKIREMNIQVYTLIIDQLEELRHLK